MDYFQKLKYHYRPQKGWINDPNGLCFYKGYYHLFFQHAPNHEIPWKEPIVWGHAITKDFINFEPLPIALPVEHTYENFGCWSGTAIVHNDRLYLFYASIYMEPGKDVGEIQTISVAYSDDGINFQKYDQNPIIGPYPKEGSHDFRDPCVAFINDRFYLLVATGNDEHQCARLLLYESNDLLNWKYNKILLEWEKAKCAECPSIMQVNGKVVISTSVCNLDGTHFFKIMVGSFSNDTFIEEFSGNFERGPDEYAGQLFVDHKNRIIQLTWIPGWHYQGFVNKDIGCLSLPREITFKNNKIYAFPIEEVRHLLKDDDEKITKTDNGFIVERVHHGNVIYNGKIDDLKVLRDEYIMEIFLNGGEIVYSILL